MNAAGPVPVRDGGLLVDALGAGSGYPTARRDTSSLLIGAAEGWTLVDCPGSLVHKLAARGLSPATLRRVILTHDHVDHVYGFPHLIQALAIAGSTEAIHFLGCGQAMATIEAMVEVHGLGGERYPEIRRTTIEMDSVHDVLNTDSLRVTAGPAEHTRDTLAFRFETTSAAVCYSADTRPCATVAELAAGTDVLLHDCAGPHRLRETFAASHSSALEAARVAADAGAARLVLFHLGARDDNLLEECRTEAVAEFGGPVELAEDGMRWTIPAQENGP